jgi:GT2 family glycosyltransferase
LLSKCIDELSLRTKAGNSNLYEIIVTDDSKDGIAEHLVKSSYPGIKWVKGPAKGPAANRNNGAKYAKGEWLLFIDDDCIPDGKMLSEYSEAIKAYNETEVFEGFTGADREKRSFVEESPINETGGFLWSCNFMILKKLFDELNGFDVNFPFAAMEDVDLRYRIGQIGKQIKFIPTARVIHPWRLEVNMLFKTKMRIQSISYFLKKHPEMKKNLDALYFLKLSKNYFIDLIRNSLQYRFRGFHKQCLVCIMYLNFSMRLFINKSRGSLN